MSDGEFRCLPVETLPMGYRKGLERELRLDNEVLLYPLRASRMQKLFTISLAKFGEGVILSAI